MGFELLGAILWIIFVLEFLIRLVLAPASRASCAEPPLVSTMGAGFWPVTAEGRVLALLLAVYGLGVFGYLTTASFAIFFIEREAVASGIEVGGAREIFQLRADIAALRDEVRQMTAR